MCPDYEIKPSPGSRRGQHFISASKDRIPNVGEQVLNVVTEDGSEGRIKYQVADISRPLNAVSDICDGGNRVIFGKSGGIIYNISSGKETYFNREEGIDILICWVKPSGLESNGDYTRPER